MHNYDSLYQSKNTHSVCSKNKRNRLPTKRVYSQLQCSQLFIFGTACIMLTTCFYKILVFRFPVRYHVQNGNQSSTVIENLNIDIIWYHHGS